MAISGNLDSKALKYFSNILNFFWDESQGEAWIRRLFGDSIIRRLVVTQASVNQKAEEPLKQEGRVVCELIVTEGMYELALEFALVPGCDNVQIRYCSICFNSYDYRSQAQKSTKYFVCHMVTRA
jgi:acyl-coenzyme A thioesterase 13